MLIPLCTSFSNSSQVAYIAVCVGMGSLERPSRVSVLSGRRLLLIDPFTAKYHSLLSVSGDGSDQIWVSHGDLSASGAIDHIYSGIQVVFLMQHQQPTTNIQYCASLDCFQGPLVGA